MTQSNEWQVILGTLQALLNCLLTIFTFFAAIAAWRSANAAKQASLETRGNTRAQILTSMLDTYASPAMLDAILELNAWTKKHGDIFADEFRRLRRENYEQVKPLDQARRRLAHYYEKVFTLLEEELIDEKLARSLLTQRQVTFMREVIEPLEAALNPEYERQVFDTLGSLYGIAARKLPMANP